MGRLIPAGTGRNDYKFLDIQVDLPASALEELIEEENEVAEDETTPIQNAI